MSNIVFWSGGEDSTLTAIQLLRARKWVTLITLDNSVIGGARQQNLEAIVRKKALVRMEKEFGKDKIIHKTVTFDADFKPAQQPTMFAGLFPLLCEDKDIAHWGVIQTDTFWHMRHLIEPAFKAMCDLCQIKVELKYPLEWYTKKMVHDELKKFGYLDVTIHSGDSL